MVQGATFLEDPAHDDGVDDLSFVGHETRHVMTEVLNDVFSAESSSKVNPMVTHEGHEIYKVSLLLVTKQGSYPVVGSGVGNKRSRKCGLDEFKRSGEDANDREKVDQFLNAT
ncbi:hypothetical protein R1sor_003023 [Riccia sorocarpa]|uniref:Uncharacterized protein n=1 Tax=Riccia sorocarpa TaxID=122646 RepID=A0ABD3H4K7_9MARC